MTKIITVRPPGRIWREAALAIATGALAVLAAAIATFAAAALAAAPSSTATATATAAAAAQTASPSQTTAAAQTTAVAVTNAPLPRDSIYQLKAALTDQSGRALSLASRRGQAQVVVMFYTGCKFICPTIIDTVLDMDSKLAPNLRQRLGVLLISLDPLHDDPKALRQTADKRGLDLTRWTLAQPRPQDLRAIAGVLGVRFRPLDDGEINHTGVLVLLDAEGRILARSEQTAGAVEPKFLAAVRVAVSR